MFKNQTKQAKSISKDKDNEVEIYNDSLENQEESYNMDLNAKRPV